MSPRLNLPSTVSRDDDEPDYRPVPRAGDHSVIAELVGGDFTTPITVDQVPAPYLARDADELDETERAALFVCERAVAGLQRALAVAGKALATINQARLYRETHATFADYVEDRWDMKRAHAYRLIEAWPVAAALSPWGDIPEKHIRALLPAVKRHGLETTCAVYDELGRQVGRVTTSRVQEAVRALPARVPDPDMARYVVRQAVREGRIALAAAEPSADPGPRDEADTGPVAQMRKLIEQQKAIYDRCYELVPAVLAADPGTGEELMRELRAFAQRTAHRNRAFGEPATYRAEE